MNCQHKIWVEFIRFVVFYLDICEVTFRTTVFVQHKILIRINQDNLYKCVVINIFLFSQAGNQRRSPGWSTRLNWKKNNCRLSTFIGGRFLQAIVRTWRALNRFSNQVHEKREIKLWVLNSMTSVVEYQYWVHKNRFIFANK